MAEEPAGQAEFVVHEPREAVAGVLGRRRLVAGSRPGLGPALASRRRGGRRGIHDLVALALEDRFEPAGRGRRTGACAGFGRERRDDARGCEEDRQEGGDPFDLRLTVADAGDHARGRTAGGKARVHVVLVPPEKRIASGIDFRWCRS